MEVSKSQNKKCYEWLLKKYSNEPGRAEEEITVLKSQIAYWIDWENEIKFYNQSKKFPKNQREILEKKSTKEIDKEIKSLVFRKGGF